MRMILLRRTLGEVLRRHRGAQHRTLRDVSDGARVSLGYLSEVERGQKEPSSELLAAICTALHVPLSTVLREASDDIVLAETAAAMAGHRGAERMLERRIGGRLVVAPRVAIQRDESTVQAQLASAAA